MSAMSAYRTFVRLLLNGEPGPGKAPVALWSDRSGDAVRQFYDAAGHEWTTAHAAIVCDGCGRAESWGWRLAAAPHSAARCKRCVKLTYTDWEG